MYHSVKVLIALLFKSYTKDQEINDKSEATIFFRFFRKCYLFHFLRHQLFVDPAWGTCATTIFQILQYDISFSEIQSVITPLLLQLKAWMWIPNEKGNLCCGLNWTNDNLSSLNLCTKRTQKTVDHTCHSDCFPM